MKAIELTRPITSGDSFDSWVQRELGAPKPRRGLVLVQMRAASLNYIDLLVARGLYPGVEYPVVPVADGAGEVVEVGDDVDILKRGDRVAIHPKSLWASGRGTARKARAMRGVSAPGVLQEVIAVVADTVVRAPDHLSWEQIASTPIAATTAWNALEAASIGPGKSVLLLGTGGVSIFGLQLAKARGASVIITSSSDEKLERARVMGADHLINYHRTPPWDEAVLALTGGEGVDLVIETGGARTFSRSLNSVRQGGVVYTIGFLTGAKVSLDLMSIVSKAIRVVGANTGSAENLGDALAAIAARRIEPVVDRVFDLSCVREAYAVMSRGRDYFGKLAITTTW